MSDQSELDRKYFIDGNKYNCPFCNRRSVVYTIVKSFTFDWSNIKTTYGYIVRCGGCNGESLHLSFYQMDNDNFELSFELKDAKGKLQRHYPNKDNLDKYFFYNHPTSFFTLDSRIPSAIRELVAEADGCRKMNFLVGASGALRKSIYKFLNDQKAEGESYEDKIKWLKGRHPLVASEYFDALANIQDMTSEELHEDKDWESWTREEFDFIVATVKAVLREVYVVPDERRQILTRVLKLGPEKKAESEKSKS